MLILRNLLSFYKYKRKHISFQLYRKNCYSSNNLKVLFFGTDSFSLPSLQVLHDEKSLSNLSALGVVTSFKNPSNCVKNYASKYDDLEVYPWPVTAEICKKYSLGVVVSFGHLIPEKIIASFSLGMINLHASILPRWRGAAPIIHAIKNGDETTGVTIMKIEPKRFDVGDILCNTKIEIRPDVLMPELHQELALKGAILLKETIRSCPKCFINFKKQNESLVTYAPKISPDFAIIKWNKMSAKQVYDLYRSLYSYKNLITKFKNINVKIVDLRYRIKNSVESNDPFQPGYIVFSKKEKCLNVFCNNGDYVEIVQIKIEGKKVMNAEDFNNGFLKKSSQADKYFI